MVRPRLVSVAFALMSVAGVSAYATSVDFTFDTQTINGTVITGLSSGATSAQIQTYMNSVLTAAGCAGCSVTVLVSGSTIGAVADQTYNGDGHVTGPNVTKSGVTTAPTSLTLGDSNGATASNTNSVIGSTDTFIANTNDSSGTVSQQITLQFKNMTGLAVTNFDYEVFPDGTCPQLNPTNCGGTGDPNQPDLKFEAGNNTNGTDALVSSFGTSGTALGVTPNTTDGNATRSPNSGTGAEAAPQYIGTWSGNVTGVSELDFVDWPATIGIDNLQVSFTPPGTPTVPEPASVVLMGTLVVLLSKRLRKARA